MAQSALKVHEIQKDFAAEMKRRQKERQSQQDIADVDELNRRIQSVRDGKSKFYTEDEAKVILKELGYYD